MAKVTYSHNGEVHERILRDIYIRKNGDLIGFVPVTDELVWIFLEDLIDIEEV